MTDDAKVKAVSVFVVVVPFEEPTSLLGVLEKTAEIGDLLVDHKGGTSKTSGFVIVRTTTAFPTATKEDMGEMLLVANNTAIRAVCERAKLDYGWPDAWVKALNDEMLAALEGEGGIH